MKKFVTLLLTAALAITAATSAFAADDAHTQIEPGMDGKPNPSSGSMNVSYTVSPSYTVTIPKTVKLDSDSKSNTAEIEVKDVTVAYGKKVKVALNNTNFEVKTQEGAVLPCKVMNVASDGTVLEVASDAAGKTGKTTIKFAIDANVVYSGTYSGTVTFEVSLVNAPQTTNP